MSRVEKREVSERLREVENHLNSLPTEYKQKDFDVLPSAIHVLKSNRDYQSEILEEISGKLDDDMDFITDIFYEGLNESIQHFTEIVEILGDVKHCSDVIGTALNNVNNTISSFPFHELKSLQRNCVLSRKSLELIEKIEDVMKIPKRLTEYFEKKQYVAAIKLINGAITSFRVENLLEITALNDIAQEIFQWKSRFPHMLVEGLEEYIYQKNIPIDLVTEVENSELKETASFVLKSGRKGDMSTTSDETFNAQEQQILHGAMSPKYLSVSGASIRDSWRRDSLRLNYAPNLSEAFSSKYDDGGEFHTNPSDPLSFISVCVESMLHLDRPEEIMSEIVRNSKAEVGNIIKNVVIAVVSEETPRSEPDGELDLVNPNLQHEMILVLKKVLFGRLFKSLKSHREVIRVLRRRASGKGREEICDDSWLRTIWSNAQEELETFLSLLLAHDSDDVDNMQAVSTSNLNPLNLVEEPKKRLLFSISNVHSETELEAANKLGAGNRSSTLTSDGKLEYTDAIAIFGPSPYNILLLKDHVELFERSIQNSLRMGSQMKVVSGSTTNFIHEYISEKFIPTLEHDSQMLISNILGSPAAMKLVEVGEQKQNTPRILTSVKGASGLIATIKEHSLVLRMYSSELSAVLSAILDKLHEFFVDKIRNLLEGRGSGAGGGSGGGYAKFMEMAEFYAKDPQFMEFMIGRWAGKPVVVASEGEKESELFEEEIDVLESQFFDTGSYAVPFVLISVQDVQFLASLHHSLIWFAEIIEKSLGDAFSVNGMGMRYSTRKQELEKRKEHLKKMADVALLQIKIQLRLSCFNFLIEIGKSSYQIEERIEPESFVIELNKRLSAIELGISDLIPENRLSYLFAGLPRLMSKIIVSYFSKAQKAGQANQHGVSLMLRNINALQQSLTSIMSLTDKQKSHFERAREFSRSITRNNDK